MAFGPAAATVALGERVTWSFEDPLAHTSTSDQGFWDSGSRTVGSTYARAFTSAGTFAYHCSIHPMMRGQVRVPVRVSGSPAAGWALRWSTRRAAGGVTFDVQARRGSGPWTALGTAVTTSGRRFDPARAGSWSVRARTVEGASRSGWSPPVTVTVS
jgi:hypothetical protein